MANFFAYLFQIVMSRYMSIDNFGIFNTLNSLVMILVSVGGVISFTVAKYINENKNDYEIMAKKHIERIQYYNTHHFNR